MISFPDIWVQLLWTTTVPVMMANSAWLMMNQIRNSLLMLSKGCQSSVPSEEAWNMAHTSIYVPRLSSMDHKQIWQRKGEDYFCVEKEKYAELQSLRFCWLTGRGIVCCFSGLVLHIPISTWEQTLNCNLILIDGCDVQLFSATRQTCDNTVVLKCYTNHRESHKPGGWLQIRYALQVTTLLPTNWESSHVEADLSPCQEGLEKCITWILACSGM